MRNAPDNSDDIIDSRDVNERIEELTDLETEREDRNAELSAAESALEEARQAETKDVDVLDRLEIDRDNAADALNNCSFDEADEAELKSLRAFRDELEGYAPDWSHGSTLIRDSHWTDYVQELLADIGDLPKDLPSYIVIDWDATADNIRADYTSGEFDGVTYWVR